MDNVEHTVGFTGLNLLLRVVYKHPKFFIKYLLSSIGYDDSPSSPLTDEQRSVAEAAERILAEDPYDFEVSVYCI